MAEMTPDQRLDNACNKLMESIARPIREAHNEAIRNAVQVERAKRLQLAVLARVVMRYLEEDGPNIVPHLVDTDDNYGQFLRIAVDEILGEDVQSELESAMMWPDNFTIDRAKYLEAIINERNADRKENPEPKPGAK